MFRQSLLQNITAIVIFVLVFILTPNATFGQSRGGSFDPSFNGIGYTRVGSRPNAPDTTGDIAVQPDGKIVVVGESSEAGLPDFFVVRVNEDGTADTTFNRTGRAFVAIGVVSSAKAVALQPDGKIVVGGWANFQKPGGSSSNWEATFALTRFHPDGRLDTTFGSGGKVVTRFPGKGNCEIYDITLQEDGRIVAVGRAWSPMSLAAARYNPDGSLDQTFGSGGKVITAAGNTASFSAVAMQSDGKIIAVGSSVVGQNETFITVRYMPDGALDADFADGGMARISYTSTRATSVVVQPDGAILVAGYWPFASFCIARYFPNGTLDPSFGTQGLWGPPSNYGISNPRLFLQSDGKLIVAGTDTQQGVTGFAAIRLTTGGLIDTGYGGLGKAFTAVAHPTTYSAASALQTDGRLIVAGHTQTAPPSSVGVDVAVARFRSDGQVDETLGTNGSILMNVGYLGSVASASVRQPDGKIVLAGDGPFLTRVHPDGSIDETFGDGGRAIAPVSERTFAVYAAAGQADGKILIAGGTRLGTAEQVLFVARYNGDGTIDESFGVDGTVISSMTGFSSAGCIAIQPDGRIVVAGGQGEGIGYQHIVVFRFLVDGTLDDTFQNGLRFDGNLEASYAGSIELQPDGKIVLSGGRDVIRLRFDGTLDRQFNRTGVVRLPCSQCTFTAMTVQPDGRIVVAGSVYPPGKNDWDLLVMRIYPNGTIDSAFGSAGSVLTRVSDHDEIPVGLAVRPDGKITVGGTVDYALTPWFYSQDFADFGVMQFNSDGSPDLTWGKNGVARLPLVGRDFAGDMHLDEQGRILITGTNRWGTFVGRLLSGTEPATMDKQSIRSFEHGLDGLF